MELQVLGTGSANPQKNRNPSAFLLSVENDLILIDCGEGTQFRLLEHKIKTSRIRVICISHLHGDHFFGLVGLLSSFSLNHRTEPITLIGPKDLLDVLELQFKVSGTVLTYDLHFLPTSTELNNKIHTIHNVEIFTHPLIHRVATTGFKFVHKADQYKILKEKLPENFPIPYLKMLKEGKDVLDELTGKWFRVNDFTITAKNQKIFTYLSDTAYYPALVSFAHGSDLLYHEATFTEEYLERAKATFHSTAIQAAQIAKSAQVKSLLLGHFSSRFKDEETHLSEAKGVFEGTTIAQEGTVYTL